MPSNNRYPLPFILLSVSISGCHTPEQSPPAAITQPSVETASEEYIPVQRYGRYTLIELKPQSAKQNLLLQVIDVDLPSVWTISVGDALQYVLKRSGYRLCESTSANAALFALPLPAAHLKLGPVALRDALQMLAGPAWQLQVNDRQRNVCFFPAAGTDTDTFAPIQTTPEASQ
ncbi:PilL N-terminal domain-containing protein [Pseudomonas sp. lyk4-TYG-107]|uniref:PFGI-1 class ICE element type IV pilus protein PilL2 n=1 Tax=Pseudomonas sp. lyk4-TYG-107 TaxID=3040317 RepID=UPI0025561292|nr:PilL N-terminal domain-containing protein [Pseudomonas sp. lyk4-TYG-107]